MTAHTSSPDGTGEEALLTADLALAKRIAAGEEAAFLDLYAQYSQDTFTYLLHMTGDQPVAEDLLQEVFVAVWIGAQRYTAQARLRTWVLRIAHHQFVSWMRRTQRERAHEDLIDEQTSQLPSTGPSPERLVDDAQQVALLQIAIRKLNPRHRAVIELAYGLQMSYLEMAEILRCPLGTVKSRLSIAVRELEAIMKRIEDE